MANGKPGRKKITCSLGEKQLYSFQLYKIEYQQMQILFNKLKKLRPKYYIEEGEIEND